MNGYVFSLILMVIGLGVGGLYWLVWATFEAGDVMAAMVLGGLVAVGLVIVGFGLSALAGYAHTKREQTNFTANAKENLAIMAAMQRVQNLQNSQLLKQVRQAPALSAGSPLGIDHALTFDEGVFSELDGEVEQ